MLHLCPIARPILNWGQCLCFRWYSAGQSYDTLCLYWSQGGTFDDLINRLPPTQTALSSTTDETWTSRIHSMFSEQLLRCLDCADSCFWFPPQYLKWFQRTFGDQQLPFPVMKDGQRAEFQPVGFEVSGTLNCGWRIGLSTPPPSTLYPFTKNRKLEISFEPWHRLLSHYNS